VIAERLGLPAAGVMTASFTSAADMMARALGAEGYRYVVIEHPISSASEAALGSRARKAAAEAAGLLLGRGSA
jgi:hypothetical protein